MDALSPSSGFRPTGPEHRPALRGGPSVEAGLPVVARIAGAVLVFVAVAASPRPATAQDAVPVASATCHDAVQGRLAYDYQGSTRWAEGNVEKLCEGAEATTEPAVCFRSALHDGLRRGDEGTRWHWQYALDLCHGTHDADATIACYRDRTAGGLAWRDAIEACAWDAGSAALAERAAAADEGGAAVAKGGDRSDDGKDAKSPGIVVNSQVARKAGAEVVAAPKDASAGVEAIAAEYRDVGGPEGRLGEPAGPVRTNPGNTGKRRRYEGGRIYWSSGTGAHVVYDGSIWEQWSERKWEQGPLGYPTTDPKPAGGDMIAQMFEHGRLVGRRDIGGRYLEASSGLCLTLNVFDQPNSTGDKVKRALKTAFDPREHAKALAAGAGGALVFGPGGGELASAIQQLRTAKKVREAWKGDLVHGTGVTLMECGSTDPEYQRFERDGRFIRVVAKPDRCVKAKQGQTERNGGRVQMGACKKQQRTAWYLDEGQLRNGKGKCLDVHAPQLDEEGAKIQLWTCNREPQQRWSFVRP